MTAAVQADDAFRSGKGSARDIDNASGAQTVLGRQRPSEQRYAARKVGIDDGPKTRHAIWKHDAVDPVLSVRHLASNVEVRIGGSRILGDAGHLQDHFIDRRILALRLGFDGFAGDRIRTCALLEQQVLAGLIHRFHLPAQGRLLSRECNRSGCCVG